MTAASPNRALVVCDAAEVPAWLGSPSGYARHEIRSRGDGAELNLRMAALPLVMQDAVLPRSTDLFRIAAYAYRADTAISRGGPLDVDRVGWKRDITLCVPVLEPESGTSRRAS